MVTKISGFRTRDGHIFDTEQEAVLHEVRDDLDKWSESRLKNLANVLGTDVRRLDDISEILIDDAQFIVGALQRYVRTLPADAKPVYTDPSQVKEHGGDVRG